MGKSWSLQSLMRNKMHDAALSGVCKRTEAAAVRVEVIPEEIIKGEDF